jgi:hypothetical protein
MLFDATDRLDRRAHRLVLGLAGIDQGRQHIQPVTFRCLRLRASHALDFRERGLVVALVTDRLVPVRLVVGLFFDNRANAICV